MIKLSPILLLFLFSCKTVKEVVKIETRYDSTAIKENKQLRLFLSEEIERFEKEREAWEKTGINFYPFDTGINGGRDTITDWKPYAYEAPKIEFYDNGKLKSIEGRVKTLNIDLTERTSELYDAHRTIDSLSSELERKETTVSSEAKTIDKKVKRSVLPGWIWLLLIVGWIGRGYWPIIKKYLLKIKL